MLESEEMGSGLDRAVSLLDRGSNQVWEMTGVEMANAGWQNAIKNRKSNSQSQIANELSELAPGGGNDTKGAGAEEILVEMEVKMAVHRNGIANDGADDVVGAIAAAAEFNIGFGCIDGACKCGVAAERDLSVVGGSVVAEISGATTIDDLVSADGETRAIHVYGQFARVDAGSVDFNIRRLGSAGQLEAYGRVASDVDARTEIVNGVIVSATKVEDVIITNAIN